MFKINLNALYPSFLMISFTKQRDHAVITFAISRIHARRQSTLNKDRRGPSSFQSSSEEGGEWEAWGRWSRERGREDSLRRPQLKRGPATERVQLPTGNGIPLFPGTMIRYVAVWITHNITPAGLVRGGCIRRESVGRRGRFRVSAHFAEYEIQKSPDWRGMYAV